MSFEASLNKQVTKKSKYDKPETDLDFYAKPENYEGSNIYALNRFVLAKKKVDHTEHKDARTNQKEERLNKLFDRYKDICGDIEEESNGDVTQNGDNESHKSTFKIPKDATNSTTDIQPRRHTTLGPHNISETNDTSRLYQRRRSVTAPPERIPFNSLDYPQSSDMSRDEMDGATFALRTPTPCTSRPATAKSEFPTGGGSETFRSLSIQASSRSKQLSYLIVSMVYLFKLQWSQAM